MSRTSQGAVPLSRPGPRAHAEEVEDEVIPSRGPAPKNALQSSSDRGLLNDLRILVVDDDLEIRDAVAEMLRETGAQVRVAESASEAMTAVEAFRLEVLFCDIAMPGEDGYSLL